MKINTRHTLCMEGANGSTSCTLGCAEDLEMQIGDVLFTKHAYIIPTAHSTSSLGVHSTTSSYANLRTTLTIWMCQFMTQQTLLTPSLSHHELIRLLRLGSSQPSLAKFMSPHTWMCQSAMSPLMNSIGVWVDTHMVLAR